MRRNILRPWALALVVFCCGCMATSRSGDPATLLDLSEPVDVTRSDAYLDGGTVAILLTDADGIELPFCIAGTRWENEAKANPEVGPRALYLGTLHWRDSGLAPVPAGGPEECAILYYLEEYLQREFSNDELDELGRAKSPSVFNPPRAIRPTERAVHAMQILEAVLVLKERCEPSN